MKVNCLAIVASYFDLRIRLGSTTHIVKSEPKATAPRTASISFFSCLDVLSLSVSPSSAPLNLRPILTWLCFAIIAVLLTPCNILPGPFPLARRSGPPCTGSFFLRPECHWESTVSVQGNRKGHSEERSDEEPSLPPDIGSPYRHTEPTAF